MTVGVITVRLFGGELEADKGYNRGRGVGHIINGIGNEGDTVKKNSRKSFEQRKKQVYRDTAGTAHNTEAKTAGSGISLFIVYK